MTLAQFSRRIFDERKGITEAVWIGERELTNWEVFTLPLPAAEVARGIAGAPDRSATQAPAFYAGSFTLAAPGDTFLDTRGWGKGTVWVNGQHLGRFWDIGPQQTLYVPGPWLRGKNEIVVFSPCQCRPNDVRVTAPVYAQVDSRIFVGAGDVNGRVMDSMKSATGVRIGVTASMRVADRRAARDFAIGRCAGLMTTRDDCPCDVFEACGRGSRRGQIDLAGHRVWSVQRYTSLRPRATSTANAAPAFGELQQARDAGVVEHALARRRHVQQQPGVAADRSQVEVHQRLRDLTRASSAGWWTSPADRHVGLGRPPPSPPDPAAARSHPGADAGKRHAGSTVDQFGSPAYCSRYRSSTSGPASENMTALGWSFRTSAQTRGQS
jgi:hypothetical protein